MGELNNQKFNKLKILLLEVGKSKNSSFYRDIFKKNGLKLNNFVAGSINELKNLPLVSCLELLSVPLNQRLYTKKIRTGKIVKIIRRYSDPFLVQRNLNDIKEENYGIICRRPLIFFDNSHEALEKSLWFYENNILPLVGEPNNLAVTAFSAKKYGIDFLLTNQQLFSKLFPLLHTDFDTSSIKVSIMDDCFDAENVLSIFPTHENLKFVLALPEIGAFAESCPESLKNGKLIFHPDKKSILEIKGRLIVTKLIKMPTPIIRYQTDIFIESVEKKCKCEEETCFRLI